MKIKGYAPAEPKPAARVEVFYLNPADGWAITRNDEGGNQVGDAECYFRKNDATRFAYILAEGALPICIYGRDGQLQKEVSQ